MKRAAPTVIWRKKPLWTKAKLVRKLQASLRGRVERAYLFGSHARGQATADSDVDLICVADSSRPFVERSAEFRDLWDSFGAVDLLVYTPAEWTKLRALGSSLLNHAGKDWVRVV